MITLQGYTYYVRADAHKPVIMKQGETRLTITERVDRTESAKTLNRWSYTIICPYTANETSKVGGLNSLINTKKASGPFAFQDEEGIWYSTLVGTNDATHFYDTGVYIESDISYVNLGPVLSSSYFSVEIQLVCAKAL